MTVQETERVFIINVKIHALELVELTLFVKYIITYQCVDVLKACMEMLLLIV